MGWQRVRGHELILEGFRRVVERRRLAHAYLFTGPEGVGKHLFAVELARAMLCERPIGSLVACEQCPSCVQLEAGAHPDFLDVVKPAEALEFPIELMRSTCDSFALKSARGRGKVVILNDVNDLNVESANCFLKTLEEPPFGSVLILIGTSPERQLSTIVSRCQVVRFAPLRDELVAELLQERGVASAQVHRLVRLGQGSVGLALQLADDELWSVRGKILSGLSSKPIDAVELSRTWMTFVEEAGKESAAQRRRASLLLRLVILHLEDALHLANGGSARYVEESDSREVHALASRLTPEQLLSLLERCLQADEQIERRVQLILVLEAFLDALAQHVPV